MHVAGCRCVAFCCAPLDVRVVTRESGAFSFDAFFRIVRVLFCLCCVAVCFGLVLFLCSASPLLLLLRFFVVVSVLLSPRFSPALPVFVFGFLARGCRRGRVTRRLTRAHRPALYIHACPARPSYATAPAGRLGRGCRMMHRVASVVCLPL